MLEVEVWVLNYNLIEEFDILGVFFALGWHNDVVLKTVASCKKGLGVSPLVSWAVSIFSSHVLPVPACIISSSSLPQSKDWLG